MVATYARTRYINLPSGYIIYNDGSPDVQNAALSGLVRSGANSVVSNVNTPTTNSALAYLSTLPLDICGRVAKEYVETLIAKGSTTGAETAARALYLEEWQNSKRPEPGTACEAAEVAYKNAASSNQDPILSSALAFMKAYKSESPCAISAVDYVQAVVDGKKDAEAGLVAAKSFVKQIKNLAAQGKPTTDPICASAALAYASGSGKSSSPRGAAMIAFISKALETGNGYDPACNAAAEQFINSYESGKPELQSIFTAAKGFVKLYKNSATKISESPCAAATLEYISKNDITTPIGSAMQAFINKALETGNGYDPACSAAAEEFLSSYESGKLESAAIIAAATGFMKMHKNNPSLAAKSPCTAATKAYANAIPSSPNPALNAAMTAFIDEAILSNDDGVSPACGAAAEAYFNKFAAGAGNADALLAASTAFLKAADSDPNFNSESSCARAAEAYMSKFTNLV